MESTQKKHQPKTNMHSLVTYASERQIRSIIHAKKSQLRGAMFILHDKDESEVHYHVALHLIESRYATPIINWFKGCKDKEGKPVNTFSEPLGDPEALSDYLTHSDEESIKQGKYRYPDNRLTKWGSFANHDLHTAKDSTMEIVQAILDHTPYRTLVRRYGRDFVYHWTLYTELAQEIARQENWWSDERREKRYEVGDLELPPNWDICTDVNLQEWDTTKEFTP